MKKTIIKVENISCSNCAKTIKNGLSDYDVDVNINNSTVIIRNLNIDKKIIINKLAKLGYPEVTTNNKLKRELIISICLSIPLFIGMFNHIMITEMYVPDIFSNMYLQLILATIIQFYIGKRFYLSAYHGLKQKVLGMDILVVISTTTAYFYSVLVLFTSHEMMPELYFETSALIITLILLGNYIEDKMKRKTNDALNELIKSEPKTARMHQTNKIIDIDNLQVGDLIVVYPNEKIPADSILVTGETYVNESDFTGESKPVKKAINDHLIGGSINLNNEIILRVEKIGEKSLFNQIIAAVEEASLVETKYKKLADKLTGYFVPFVLTIAVLTYIGNYLYFNNSQIALFNSLCVVLISCPYALGLATPVAISSANGVSTKRGIIYKGGNFFELAHKIDVICFDKTGTLTNGTPSIITYNIPSEYDEIIYNMSRKSNHPISMAIAKYLDAKEIELNITHLDGIGITTTYNGITYSIVNAKYHNELKPLQNTGNYFLVNDQVIGYYELKDEIKASAKLTISELKKKNIKPVMITGDNKLVAQQIANELGIEAFYAEVLPIDKSNIVTQLKTEGIVAFVGDGVNDSVALTIADIGIAVNNGNIVAIQSSDVTLMSNDLTTILDGIKISKATNANIKQNLFWAFSYNIFAIPLAATGHLNMYVAAICMGISSLLVVLNALRLKSLKFDDNLQQIKNVKISCDKCVANITRLFEENNVGKYKIDKTNKCVYVEDKEKAYKILKENNYV